MQFNTQPIITLTSRSASRPSSGTKAQAFFSGMFYDSDNVYAYWQIFLPNLEPGAHQFSETSLKFGFEAANWTVVLAIGY